jgi:NTE family protein
MFLLMALWAILELNLKGKTVVEPAVNGVFAPYTYRPVSPTSAKSTYRLGVALSGGGMKGFCHLGVLKAMEDAGIHPRILSGVSAGAVVAALYADGYSVDSILSMYDALHFMDYLSIDLGGGGLLSIDKFRDFLRAKLHAKTFEELKIPLRVVVTDLDHGTSVIFDKGPLAEALVASCSVPILFDPYVINGVHYVDGGLLHNLPAFALRQDCRFVAGVNLGPIQGDPYDKSIATIALRSYRFIFRANANFDKSLCDFLVEPLAIGKFSGSDFDRVRQMYQIGYDATVVLLDSLQRVRPGMMRYLKR